MDERVGFRSGRRGGVVPVVVLLVAVLAAACGSGSSSGSAKGPAGAKENAAATAVCRDLYTGGPVAACAENTIGPGGGVVFYDAGSVQSWGRFLEVAPWNWNPQLAPTEAYACPGGCGATRSILNPAENRTQDGGSNDQSDTFEWPVGYSLCETEWTGDVSGAAARTDTAVGAGRENTRLLLADPACGGPGTGQNVGAVNLVASYRGGGLADWYLPSKDELDRLFRFGNRNAIGGFTAKAVASGPGYLSSSVDYDPDIQWVNRGQVWGQVFGSGDTKQPQYIDIDSNPTAWRGSFLVRPIRAFS
jgi:hypothetical protein